MALGLAKVNAVHGPVPVSEQFELLPKVATRFISIDNAPGFYALTTADCDPAGFLARLPGKEAA
jgi:hypothetical protein